MQRKVTSLFTLITITLLIIVSSVVAADFYTFDWGTSYKKILKQVDEIDKSDKVVISHGVVAGYDVVVTFIFEDRKLVCGVYDFRPRTVGEAVAIFHDMKDKLLKKYGKPAGEKTKRFRSMDLSVLTEEGFMAEAMRSDDERIMFGEIGKYIVWSTKRSVISESIEPTDFVPRIVYYQVDYFEKISKQSKDKL